MDLIEKQHSALPAVGQPLLGGIEDGANFFDAHGGGVHLLEMALRVICDYLSKRGLTSTGRSIKNHAGEAIRLEHPPQQLARPQDVRLPDELRERDRSHALGQRLSAPIPGGRPREEIHARILRRGGGYVPSPQRADHPDAWPISSWGSRVDVRV